MKKLLAFTSIAFMFIMLSPVALSAQYSVKKQPPEPKFQAFVGASNSYGIDVKTKQSSVFVGGVAGITMNPHDNFIARLSLGYFTQSVIAGSAFKKNEVMNVDSMLLLPAQTFSGGYFSIAEPIELSLRHTLYFGAVIRVGKYGNGMTFSPGFYLGYMASRDLLPKSNVLIRFEPSLSLTKIENMVTADAMISLRLNFRH